jgi:signal transduction histidine kinase
MELGSGALGAVKRALAGCRAHWRRALAAGIVALVMLGFAYWISHELFVDQERQAQARVAEDGRLVLDAVETASTRIQTQMAALAGLFRASEQVTEAEFDQFSSDIGLIGGTGGYGFAPLVGDEDLQRWEADVVQGDPDYRLFGVDSAGVRLTVVGEPLHAALLYFWPPEAFGIPPKGLDLMSEPVRAVTLQRAMQTGSAVATPFMRLLGEGDNDGLVVFLPVETPQGTMLGFITTPVDLSLLVEAALPQALAERLVWQVTDYQDGQSVGLLGSSQEPAWSGSLVFGDRVWLLSVAPRVPVESTLPLVLPWVSLPAAIVGSLLCGLMVLVGASALESRWQRSRLTAVVEAKDRFLATVSHELRTPLTGVVGFLAEALNRYDMSDAEKWEAVSIAADQAQELAGIVEDLITATRVDPSGLSVNHSVINLSHEVAQVVEAFSRRVVVRMQGVDKQLLAWGDAARVRQILRNLLDNAARYGRPPVDLVLRADSERIYVHVSDHGPGVARDRQRLLFRPHQPLHPSTTQPDSLGLGLWISRHLARLMGGDLTYEPGANPCFTLALAAAPRTRARDPRPPLKAARPVEAPEGATVAAASR